MLIRVDGRDVGLGMVRIGVEGDHGVADIVFDGLPEMDAPVVTLHWTTGEAGDIVALEQTVQGWQFEITSTLTQYGGAQISAYLQMVSGEQRWHSNAFVLRVNDLPGVDATVTPPEPSVIDQLIQMVQEARRDMGDALIELGDGVDAVGQVLSEVEGYADQVSEDAQGVAADKDTTHGYMQRAETAAGGAEGSELSAGGSASQAGQALSDLLAMLGSQVATLGADGKLSPGQIPPLSINDVFQVSSAAEMLTLTAERGDVALLMVGGAVADSYILATDDPTDASAWKKLGVSYVANAGHAVAADTASDSERINGKRLIAMTQTQYDIAVKDPDTLYVVTPEVE